MRVCVWGGARREAKFMAESRDYWLCEEEAKLNPYPYLCTLELELDGWGDALDVRFVVCHITATTSDCL